jgi:hypothetical protein
MEWSYSISSGVARFGGGKAASSASALARTCSGFTAFVVMTPCA